ncbi:MAG: aminotransferase class III-fold pyridoxal phosphate-dependent enzyme [Actinomycetota bacterium]|nr:aminotransferase class III-fold pyridoxal phosphate-dependent enzyme [Actinomycetota bacterium]
MTAPLSAADRPVPPGSELDDQITEVHRRYAEVHPRSAAEHVRAKAVMPGGNTRSVLHFDPFPFRVIGGEGSDLHDLDGHRYVDFCGNYSAGLLGHSPDRVRDAVIEALADGWALGATHLRETELAEEISERFASIDQVRFTNSGTEANLMAIGTALHHSNKDKVGVFDHAYHGGVLSFGDPGSGSHHPLNVPYAFHVAVFDDIGGLDRLFAEPDLGCVVVEAVQGAGGCRPASPEFLSELRHRCDDRQVVLIFDEVMTSRLSFGGAQERYGVIPDMTTLGKYLGGGMTFGAFGGRRDIMAAFDPATGGSLTQAGTFNNNVVSMAAALATIRYELDSPTIDAINKRGDDLIRALDDVFTAADLPLWVTGAGSMLCIHAADTRLLELLFHAALSDGLYLARRGYMALSKSITDDHCERLVRCLEAWSKVIRR